MSYLVNEKDVEFNLFEWLGVSDLVSYESFKDHNDDLYKMVVSEGIKFAKNEIAPLQKVGDEEGCRLVDGQVQTPKGYKEAYNLAAQNGFVAIDIPTTYGGQGLPTSLSMGLYEAFTGSCVPFSMYMGLTRGAAFLIETFASDELKSIYCEKMYNGTWGGTMCLTEPCAGTAVGDLKTKATKNDDGSYNIVGEKIFISGGDQDLTENIIHLVLARVEGDAEGTKGISLFVVPKHKVNSDGSSGDFNNVECVSIEHKMGIKASSTCYLKFGENAPCQGFLVGEQSKGIVYMFQMMNEARMLCGLQGQAIAGAAYEHSVNYAKERIQGKGKAITEYPDVKRNLATMRSLVEGMRGLLYYTAKQIDVAHHEKDDADKKKRAQNRADLLTPICKAYCSDMGFKVTEIAMQVYGGYGYCSEYPVEQYMRDVKISSIYEGTNGVQALDLVGRKLALNHGELFREFYEDLSAFYESQKDVESLKSEMEAFKKAIDSVGQVAMKFGEWGMSKNYDSPQFFATPFLEMCGDVSLAYVLLDQAKLASEKMGSGDSDGFYKNKILTTKFFVNNILPRVRMRSKEILTDDKSAFEMTF